MSAEEAGQAVGKLKEAVQSIAQTASSQRRTFVIVTIGAQISIGLLLYISASLIDIDRSIVVHVEDRFGALIDVTEQIGQIQEYLMEATSRLADIVQDHDTELAALLTDDTNSQRALELLHSIETSQQQLKAEWESVGKTQTETLAKTTETIDVARRELERYGQDRFDRLTNLILSVGAIVVAVLLAIPLNRIIFSNRSVSAKE